MEPPTQTPTAAASVVSGSTAVKIENLLEAHETLSATADPKPEDLPPHERVVVHTDVPYAPKSRFFPGKAKEMMIAILKEKLSGATYDADTAPMIVRDITDAIKSKLKDMELDRYKLVVQAVLGEQRGQGFQMCCRCFWDPNTDNYAHASFKNDSIFCVAGAFAMYLY
ncbi:hypothetical protein R1sor_021621 [Riccia sorocarpa]|uniref:Dynein light chain n=1 Tax=Riccia sorocarpa TaxID=122646 RepID=A0ABD3GKP9_9MARC